ncbi:MAG: ChaN family lipoprotein [Bacteroidetes bacterium]|nr:ChaN family lipoprotein [Bacteroidota bacterium]
MKNVTKLSLVMVAFMLMSMKGDLPAYKLFDAKGDNTKYKNLVKDAAKADIVLFGELHDNPVCHWMQFELTSDLYAEKKDNLVLGAEMFETDNQLLLDEYTSGKIKERNFEAEAKLWKNYKTDYKPLVDFAKDHNLKFVGTNIPRRYASVVHSQGFEGLDSLDNAAKLFFAPLPMAYDPELPGYAGMLEMMSEMGGGHTNDNLPKAQAVKDATMAYFILQNWEPGKTFLHYNGSFHSENYEGIVWYLRQANPDLNILTISTVEQDTISALSDANKGLADYILCIPSTMTKTYSSSGGF